MAQHISSPDGLRAFFSVAWQLENLYIKFQTLPNNRLASVHTLVFDHVELWNTVELLLAS